MYYIPTTIKQIKKIQTYSQGNHKGYLHLIGSVDQSCMTTNSSKG